MKITEFGIENEKIFLLLPGPNCTWEINYNLLTEPLSQEFHVLCVNYTGFDGSGDIFVSLTDETIKIEEYIQKNFGGSVSAIYGSSMGGNVAAVIAQRKVIHADHIFIGSADLDQAMPFVARIEAGFMTNVLCGVAHSPKKTAKFDIAAQNFMGSMMVRCFNALRAVDPLSVFNQFYSDLVTVIEKDISVPGTQIHVFYAEKMGKKYLKRYKKHFRDANIVPFNTSHEGWLSDPDLMIGKFKECMG